MIQHVVLFRLKAEVTKDAPRVQAFHQAMQSLPQRIAVINTWQCGFNLTPSPAAADYVLVAGFNTDADLQAYFVHPVHEALLSEFGDLFSLQFADFVI